MPDLHGFNNERDRRRLQRELNLMSQWRRSTLSVARNYGIEGPGAAIKSMDERIDSLQRQLSELDNPIAAITPSELEKLAQLVDLKEVGRILIKARYALGWSRQTLAEYTNMSLCGIKGIERGLYKTTKFENLLTIATILSWAVAQSSEQRITRLETSRRTINAEINAEIMQR